jgi:putative PIN family toxin of toxin-antitoxin system
VRIVLDTNVVLSALLWRGAPYQLFQIVRNHERIHLFASPELIAELGEVLIRPHIQKRLSTHGRAAFEFLADYVDSVDLVTPMETPRVIANDSDDDHVIAAAVASDADMIVSGDNHLLALESHRGIRILNPADAQRLILTER